jgi:hypothetical protein
LQINFVAVGIGVIGVVVHIKGGAQARPGELPGVNQPQVSSAARGFYSEAYLKYVEE